MQEDKKKTQVWLFLSGLGVICISTIALLVSCTVLKNWIIISFGVRTLSTVYVGELIVLGLSFGFTIARSIPFIKISASRKREKERQLAQSKQRSQVLTNYNEDSENPEFTRKRLHFLQNEMPGLDNLVERCLGQMDRMDGLQARQEVLIETNDALYLKDTVAVFDNVERRICRNFRNVINLCIAADSSDALDMGKIEQILSDNDKKLSDTKALLQASVEWINQYNADNTDDRSEVESWIAVIYASLKED